MRNNTTALLVAKVRQMDEELRYLRAFFRWMITNYDKFYRLHEEFNDEYGEDVPHKYKNVYE